jgi:CubicO group peptidase (beta-lactamase class C family)
VDFRELCALMRDETRRHCVPLLDIALVNEQRIVLRRRFTNGIEEAVDPAAPPAIFRAGSISKMLTAVSIMRSVEAGEVGLDVPLTAYCPELVFSDPHGSGIPITLRHLLSHTAGIQRESPVGSYYDSTEPGIDQSVRSMIGTALVFPPGTRAKYSNIGPTMAAYMVEKVTGVPWQERIERAILVPLGMEHSSFGLTHRPMLGAMTEAFMPGLDGPISPAPRFDLGTAPSGNLYSTAEDLALFMRCLLAGGSAGSYPLLRAETLQEMWRIQLASPGSSAGFGLGFMIGALDGHRHVGHGGAVYGYSSDFVACIDDKVGVIVLNNLDCTGGVNAKIRNTALECMLSHGEEPEDRSGLPGFAGIYRAGDDESEVTVTNGALVLRSAGTSKRLRRVGANQYVSDDRLSTGLSVVFLRDAMGAVAGLTAGETRYRKAQGADAAGTSSAGIAAFGVDSLRRFCGDYGPPHAGLRLFLRASRLVCRIEWFYEYDLSRIDESRFLFPAYGMFEGEDLRFIADPSGAVIAVSLSGIRFQRREGGTSEVEN